MPKKLLIIISLAFFLTACGQKGEIKIDYKAPTSGPDATKMIPSYGPNDIITNPKS